TFVASVALSKRVPAGSGVSYGHRYTTTNETTLALIPIGYADGVPRNASNTAEVWIGGQRRRISGTVCMDQFVVDVGDDGVDAGEPFGRLRGRTRTVLADDGVPLHVEEAGDLDAPLTIVFIHGYVLNMHCWHYQWRDLGGAVDPAGRLVFYDHRGHGRSGRSA